MQTRMRGAGRDSRRAAAGAAGRLPRGGRRALACLAACLAAALLTGCQAVASVRDAVRETLIEKQADIYAGQFEEVTEEELAAAREKAAAGDYAYGQLPAEDQKLYLELLSALEGYRSEVKLRSMDPEQVDRAYQAIMMDHPELFYVEGYVITEHMVGGQTEFYTFSGQYSYTPEERDEKQALVDEAVADILRGAPADGGAYEKEKYVYDYLVRHTVYDESAPDNQNILSVFLNGASVCQGYAYATQYLLKELGIPCTTVTGTALNPEGKNVAHAWNLVMLDGEYYYVDTTWGDPVAGQEAVDSGLVDEDYVNYDYLNLTSEQMGADHTPNAAVPLPECTAETYNYYRYEGLWYEAYDLELVAKRLEAARAAGQEYLTMKFPDQQTYETYIENLFDRQEIFQADTSIRQISYIADPSSRMLLISLE